MRRVIEPELMTEESQVEAYSKADFATSDKSFCLDLYQYLVAIRRLPSSGSLIVDLGCGPGNISQRVSTLWPEADVVGVDGSELMIDAANRRMSRFLIGRQRLSYHCLNILELGNGSNGFARNAELVLSNSLLHHLHNPNDLWRTIFEIAKPGSVVFHRDLRRPISREKAIEIQLRYMPEAPSVLIRDFLASLHAAFTVEEVRAQLEFAKLDYLQVIEVNDRYLQVFGIV